jgi:PAS domain S-box-containing protein
MPNRSTHDARQRLRDEAARRLRESPRDQGASPPSNLLHELQVHQIELEMQNEELRRAQAELLEARDLYSEVFHFAPVGYLILSGAGLIQDANLNGASLLGVERTRLLGRPFITFLGREERDRWNLIFPTLLRRGEWLSLRLTMHRNDGSTLHARLACEGQGCREGKPVVRAVVTDVGEQVRAEQALQEKEERLGEVLDEFRDGYWDWLVDGNQVVISRQLRRMLGFPDDGHDETRQSYEAAWKSGVHPEDLPRLEATLSDLLHGRRQAFQVDCRWRHSGTAWTWFRAQGRVATADGRGRAVRVKGTVSDITELKQLQESYRRLEAREAMQGAMVRNFPGGAIGLFDHDLRYVLVDGNGEVGPALERQALAGGLVFELYPPEHRERITVALRAALAGRTSEVETRIAGQAVEIRAGPVTDSDGRVVMGVATVQVVGRREPRGL